VCSFFRSNPAAPVDTKSEVPTTKPSGDAGSEAQEGARAAHPRDEDDAFATFQGGIFSGCEGASATSHCWLDMARRLRLSASKYKLHVFKLRVLKRTLHEAIPDQWPDQFYDIPLASTDVGTSEQKAELTAMMKQQADQADEVDRLRTHNDELGQTVEEQTQLLESTLEVNLFITVGRRGHQSPSTTQCTRALKFLAWPRSR